LSSNEDHAGQYSDQLAALPLLLLGGLEYSSPISYQPLIAAQSEDMQIKNHKQYWVLGIRGSIADDLASPGWGVGLSSLYSFNEKWSYHIGLEYNRVRLKDKIKNASDQEISFGGAQAAETVRIYTSSNNLGEFDWLSSYSALYIPLGLNYHMNSKVSLGLSFRPGLILDSKLEKLPLTGGDLLDVDNYVFTDLKNRFDFQIAPSLSWNMQKNLSVSVFWDIGLIQFAAVGKDRYLDFLDNSPFNASRSNTPAYFHTNNLGLKLSWRF
jgi:hypothetical protein